MRWEDGVSARAQKGWGLLRNVGIHTARKQFESGRMQKNAVRRFPQHPGAVCQNSSKTVSQAVPLQKFCCNGEVAAAQEQVITPLAGKYGLRVLRACDARPHVFDG